MGCDIHVHVEVKINNEWHHYSAPSVDRWYWLFGAMAGVRSAEVKPVAWPKGFPKDASLITRLEYARESRDAHTPSWLNGKEVLKLIEKIDKKINDDREENEEPDTFFNFEYSILRTYPMGDSFREFMKRDWKEEKWMPEGVSISGVRLVFWFDN